MNSQRHTKSKKDGRDSPSLSLSLLRRGKRKGSFVCELIEFAAL